jgi:hypothetical protein
MRPCIQCNGSKIIKHSGFVSLDGTVYPEATYSCSSCNGRGEFPEVDESEIRDLIIVKQGKTKGKLKSSLKLNGRYTDYRAARAYFVWRLARFHGGIDVTLPMTAETISRGDPYKDHLDTLADIIAKESFGTNMAGAIRWGRAFGVL